MNLATFEYADLSDQNQLDALLLAEEMEHHTLALAAQRRGLAPVMYHLAAAEDMASWLDMNGSMHQQLGRLRDMPVGELIDWDLSDKDQAAQWLLIEIEDHKRLRLAYGLP